VLHLFVSVVGSEAMCGVWNTPLVDASRQGWTAHVASSNTPTMEVQLKFHDLEDAWVLQGECDVRLKVGGTYYRFEDLVAWDANGQSLPAAFVFEDGQLQIQVDTTEATFPVYIDPDFSAEEDQFYTSDPDFSAFYGGDLSSAGDVDGDGFEDLLVGAKYDDSNTGVAYLYYGSGTGLDTSSEVTLTASDGDEGHLYGASVASAGDLNGDGYDDVVVGAPHYNLSLTSQEGAAYIYYGSATGLVTGTETQLMASDLPSTAAFGERVAGVGDLDGDGYDDLAIGAPEVDGREGVVYLYYGSATGLSVNSETILYSSEYGVGSSSTKYFGSAVGAAGDLNADGYDDMLVGARSGGSSFTGGAFVYYGSSTGLDSGSEVSLGSGGGDFGTSISGGHDANGDGYLDVLVGAPGYALGTGAAFLYWGSATGFGSSDLIVPATTGSNANFGHAVALVSDLNGDGIADIIAGAPQHSTSLGTYVGKAYAFYGTSTGVGPWEDEISRSDAAPKDYFGTAVMGLGDIDGDGYGDLLVGSPLHSTTLGGAGSFYQYTGGCTDDDLDGVCYADDCDDFEISTYPGAVDICGDGVDSDCDDVGGPDGDEDGDGLSYTEEQAFGTSDCALDTDGDGLDDALETGVLGTDPLSEDTDGDGIGDADEVSAGTDPLSADTDGDGLSDSEEEASGTDPLVADSDGDGLDDGRELELGTDPLSGDSDGDGLSDGEEDQAGSDPNSTDGDGDGCSDFLEVTEMGTDPGLTDTDGDGLGDCEEPDLGLDPLNRDTDGDGSWDGSEINNGTDPLNPDCDSDGVPDGSEIAAGTDPWDPDTDDDGLSDAEELYDWNSDPLDVDTDDDMLEDGEEVELGTNLLSWDTDWGNVGDGQEVLFDGTDPLDGRDDLIDSDGDGLLDGEEDELGTDKYNPDTDGDGTLDGEDRDPLNAGCGGCGGRSGGQLPGAVLLLVAGVALRRRALGV
jgi:hypothetical protein